MFIIMEGLDNVGKDTQIRNLQTTCASKFNIETHVLHYSNIKGLSGEKCKLYSEKLYRSMFNIMDDLFDYNKPIFILNRSHIGEAIYSPMYRNYNGDYVFDIEKEFCNRKFWKTLSLIVFIDNAENLIKRDDGLSFTTDLNKKEMEIGLFKSAFKKSNIKNKKLININKKDIGQVYNEMWNFLIKGE